jgi:hypothetical protein
MRNIWKDLRFDQHRKIEEQGVAEWDLERVISRFRVGHSFFSLLFASRAPENPII